jgi:uncharacterized membrane protein YfcA
MIPLEWIVVFSLIPNASNFIYFNLVDLFYLTNNLSWLSIFLSILSGIIVGFSLGLIGGGGSILAVPLLVFVIGIDTHIAIGTSALAVAANALVNLFYRRNKKCIRIKEGILFTIPGAFGTLIGAQLGLLTPSENLLILFALFMIIISSWMLKNKNIDKEKIKNIVKINDDDKKNSERWIIFHNNGNEHILSFYDSIR